MRQRGQRLIEFEIEVDADPRLSLTFIKDLLETDAACGVHPDSDLGEVLADTGIFCDEFQLVGLHVVECFLAGVGNIPLFRQVSAAGAEAEEKISADFVVLVGGYLIGNLFVELKLAFGVLVNLEGMDLPLSSLMCAAIWKLLPLRS